MKPLILGVLVIALLIALPAGTTLTAPAQESGLFRCGSDLVEIGDHAYLVFQKCGPPLERQLIGYSLSGTSSRELTVEEWIYGPRAGYYYFVTFVGGRVSEILTERD